MTKAEKYSQAVTKLPPTPTLTFVPHDPSGVGVYCEITEKGRLYIRSGYLMPDQVLNLRDWLTEWFDEAK